MTAEDIERARGRRARLDGLADGFMAHFRAAGFGELTPEPAVPTEDRTILFTNSAVVPFKPFLRGDRDFGGNGVMVRQPCVRAHNFGAVFAERFATEFLLQFEMLGALFTADGAEAAAVVTGDYFSRALGLAPEDVLFHVASDDTDLIGLWRSVWPGPVETDAFKRSYYRWGFGDPRLSGRGATFAIAQGDGTYRDLGNLIAFENEGEATHYGFGIGLETLAVCLDRLPWVLECVPAGAVSPLSTTDEGKLADLVGLLVRLYADDVRISSRAQGHVLRKAVGFTLKMAERLGTSQDRILGRIADLAAVEAPGKPVAEFVRDDFARISTERTVSRKHDLSFWCEKETSPDELAAAVAATGFPDVVGLAAEVKDVWDGASAPGRRSVTLGVEMDLPVQSGRDDAKEVLRRVAARLGSEFGVALRGEIR
ncbi:alanine--tRNA ligase-related protein [Amycolatopsis umgeniensis]|uniref:Alanyl-tRNA synthetase class IIc N-terminal domain-containing protein n=1 Tax=Amycolatopsis umgeniensis TaxID=336628 RepID=A0A841BAN7_9PSEU|nr:alanine--tRNA ligase-related protein [Amycolatopsis umgeniensis]MBB5855708.1 hypothetical protein [Amycolatopsis umgeniensis]